MVVAALLIIGPPLHPLIEAVRYLLGKVMLLSPGEVPKLWITAVTGGGVSWVVVGAAALMVWPRLWVLVPNTVIGRIMLGFFTASWVDLVQNGAALLIAIPLLLIGLSSAWRRLPSPAPDAPGAIVPNADGIGALLALPFVIFLGLIRGQWSVLLGLAAVFAAVRMVSYARKNALITRGRGWVVFMMGLVCMLLYCLWWGRPDWSVGWALGIKAAPVAGVYLWAIQRGVLPYRNVTTTP